MDKLSTTGVVLVAVLHLILFVTGLLVLTWFLGGKFDSKHPFAIDEGARQAIFGGFPAIGVAVFMCYGEAILRAIGEKAVPYALFGMVVTYILGGYILYAVLPKHWVLPLGIAGWITTFSLLLWLFVLTDPLKHFGD